MCVTSSIWMTHDTFCAFDSEGWFGVFHGLLNQIQPALRFACEKRNAVLTFLHVFVHRSFIFYLCVP